MDARIYNCVFAVGFTLLLGCKTDAPVEGLPTVVVASTHGGMNYHTGWELSVNSSGKASLVVGSIEPTTIEFAVEHDELVSLMNRVSPHLQYLQNNKHVFVGLSSPDEVVRTLLVIRGDKVLSVSFHHLDDLTPAQREAVDPLIEARHVVRRWIDPVSSSLELLDMRDYERNQTEKSNRGDLR